MRVYMYEIVPCQSRIRATPALFASVQDCSSARPEPGHCLCNRLWQRQIKHNMGYGTGNRSAILFPLGGDSFDFGSHFHCQLLVAPCSASRDRIGTHVATSSALQGAAKMASNTEDFWNHYPDQWKDKLLYLRLCGTYNELYHKGNFFYLG
jgi:hypothetical protein